MSNDFELSRRKALAALGSIGVASAGAGLGTSAYFSDQETFENNRLVAGELDLKMDWEEHYSDWSADEGDDPTNGTLDIQMEEPGDIENYTAYPPGVEDFDGVEDDPYVTGDPLLWVHNDDVEQFMANTAIEAFPDENGDAVAEFPLGQSDGLPCDFLSDVGADDDGLDPTGDGLRTENEDTYDGEAGEPLPLINLDDVKPGDFGEVTFSAHICDNDGYLWLNGALRNASENGTTEPEADDPDEKEGVVELLDTVQTALWYDNNCNNLVDRRVGEVDIVVAADTSGSIEGEEQGRLINAANAFAEALPTDGSVQAGLVTFGDDTVTITDTIGPVSQFLDGSGNGEFGNSGRLDSFGGNTPMPAALDAAQAELQNGGRPNAEKIILLVTDGGPNYDPETVYQVTTSGGTSVTLGNPLGSEGGDGTYPGGATSPSATVSSSEIEETIEVAQDIEADTDTNILTAGILNNTEDQNVDGSPRPLNNILIDIAGAVSDFFNTEFGPDLIQTAQNIAQRVSTSDQVFFQGTLREALTAMESDNGIPLDGNRTTDFDETGGTAASGDREPFDASMTHCFGLSWWLPLDHGNEVQSDSVNFDIGFYTEQARHNDGAGMNNTEVSTGETDA